MSPVATDLLFGTLTLLTLIGGAYALRLPQSGAGRSLLIVVPAWLLLTALLAASGWLAHWTSLPPRLLLVLVPPVLGAILLLRSRRVGTWLDALPLAALVAPQVFRVGVELLLWALYRQGRLPVQMTFEGRNWDVLVGLTALPVAWWLARHPSRLLAAAWHVAGLLLLANIVVVAILSTPLPFRVFHNAPANTIIATFPYVWLPGVLVPVAYTLHLLGLRQALRRRTGSDTVAR